MASIPQSGHNEVIVINEYMYNSIQSENVFSQLHIVYWLVSLYNTHQDKVKWYDRYISTMYQPAGGIKQKESHLVSIHIHGHLLAFGDMCRHKQACVKFTQLEILYIKSTIWINSRHSEYNNNPASRWCYYTIKCDLLYNNIAKSILYFNQLLLLQILKYSTSSANVFI